MIWDQLTSVQINNLDRNTPVILSISATEQHGAHLPVSTDRLIGEHFVHVLEEMMPDKILVLPSVCIGCSTHHMDFAGSLTLSHTTFQNQVTEIIQSVIHHGFKKILLLNSHGGNQGIGQVIVEKLGYQHPDCHFVLATWWRIAHDQLIPISESGKGGTGHACEFETSLILHIAPHLVHMNDIEQGDNQDTFDWATGDMLYGASATYYKSMIKMTPNGIFGNPLLATAEKGKRITNVVKQALQTITTDLYKLPL